MFDLATLFWRAMTGIQYIVEGWQKQWGVVEGHVKCSNISTTKISISVSALPLPAVKCMCIYQYVHIVIVGPVLIEKCMEVSVGGIHCGSCQLLTFRLMCNLRGSSLRLKLQSCTEPNSLCNHCTEQCHYQHFTTTKRKIRCNFTNLYKYKPLLAKTVVQN